MMLTAAIKYLHPSLSRRLLARRPLGSSASSGVPPLHISHEVQAALKNGSPIVALESTIISHGMPYPRNLEVARQVENVVRKNGATPATIAIIDGIPKIGLTEEDLLRLARDNKSIRKASTRDLGYVCSQGLSAATTVASTMRLAHLAGISVFATGGIGGVHRGGESTMDVSADLTELSRTPVTVVCAGIKSILDIPKTLEVLETLCVPVLGYNCADFPAFFTNDSGIKSPLVAFNSSDVASLMLANKQLQLNSGVLVGCPNPSPVASSKAIHSVVQQALLEAEQQGISGAGITPFVLAKVEKLSGGSSLDSNIELVLNNAKIASEIARDFNTACAAIRKTHEAAAATTTTTTTTTESAESVTSVSTSSAPDSSVASEVVHRGSDKHDSVIVIGGAVVDYIGRISTAAMYSTSNPGIISTNHGGVGRNIAESLSKYERDGQGVRVGLASAVANDASGVELLRHAAQCGISTSLVRVLPSVAAIASLPVTPAIIASSSDNTNDDMSADSNSNTSINITDTQPSLFTTATYNAIHNRKGELCIGIADMRILDEVNESYVKSISSSIEKSNMVVCDANLSVKAFSAVADLCSQYNKALFFEPTSDHKCLLPLLANSLNKVAIIKPNVSELHKMIQYCIKNELIINGRSLVVNSMESVSAALSRGAAAAAAADGGSGEAVAIDDTDVRILATALHHVMSSSSSGSNNSNGSSAAKPSRSSTGTGRTSGAAALEPPSIVTGKHIIVSMGSAGVLWCGPKKCVQTITSGHHELFVKGSLVVDDHRDFAVCKIAARPVGDGIMKHTNGAGDALCAGIIAEVAIRAENQKKQYDGKIHLPLPDAECIVNGLNNAYKHLSSRN